MARTLPYGLGIIIPCLIISVIGYTFYFHTGAPDYYIDKTVWVFLYILVWLSYAMAVFKDPGRVRLNAPSRSDPRRRDLWCAKCKMPKPERSHHCSVCKRCVLKMDHHCPWTANCVGHANMPHFLRFLFWVVGTCIYTLCLKIGFLWWIWKQRMHAPYLVSVRNVVWSIVGCLLDAFIVITVGLLFIRVVSNLSSGTTQIEAWEQERVHSLVRRKLIPRIEFPFDLDLYDNLYNSLGPIYMWLVPWGGSVNDGHAFDRLEPAKQQRWPPDTSNSGIHEFYRQDRWISPEGEILADFGVEVESETDGEDIPLQEVRENLQN